MQDTYIQSDVNENLLDDVKELIYRKTNSLNDENVFAGFYRKIKPVINNIIRYLYGSTYDEDEIDFLITDIVMKIYNNITSFDVELNFKNWMYSIIRNSVSDYYRQNKRLKIVSIDEAGEISIDSNDDNGSELIGVINSMINKMPDDIGKKIFIENTFNNMSLITISDMFDMSYHSVKIKNKEFKRKLKDKLEKNEEYV